MSKKGFKKTSKLSGARNRFFRKLRLVGGSLFLTLLMVELALRIVGFSEPSLFYMYDHDRGISLRPSAEGWWHMENNNYVRINSQGLRDREHTRMKPPGTLRIAVLGDSYAEALQVPLEDAFWAQMERGLQQCPNIGGRKIEVLNFGVSGYGTAQELITLRERVWDYSPDIVLLAFTTGNDVNDNLKQLSNDPMRPYFVYRDDKLALDRSMLDSREASGSFRVRNSLIGRAFDWSRQRLRVLQLVTSVGRAVVAASRAKHLRADLKNEGQPSGNQIANAGNKKPGSSEPGLDNMVYYEPVDETWKEAWRITEELISQMQDEVKSRGASFYVVTLSSATQVSPNVIDYEKTLQSWELNDLFYPDARIRRLGEGKGFAVLNLAPALKEYAEQHSVYLHGFGERRGSGHWNQAGHRAAGEMIAGWLCTESAR